MDPAALAGRLEAIDARLAGTDAERRAAALCAGELRRMGRRPRTQALWFRRQREAPRVLYAALGVAGSVVAVGHPIAGTALAGGALVAAVVEALGVPVAGRLQTRRATQNVVSAPVGELGPRVLLVLTASIDAPRNSILRRLESRLGRRWLPGGAGLLLLALAAVVACTAARVAGAEGAVVGAAQLVPSVVLIVLVGAFADAAVAHTGRGPAAGAAVALATAETLEALPPRALAVEVLIAGAGEAGAAGMAHYVRARRRELAAEDVVVLHLGSAGGGTRVVTHEGEHVAVRLHPRLGELALAQPGVRAARARRHTGARVARDARWPAIALEGEPRALAAAALRLIAAIDAEVGARDNVRP